VLAQVWDEPVQRARALDGLVADGLVDPLPDGTYALPSAAAPPAASSSDLTTSTRSTSASLRR
jgi:A/G-specific adenine glycosylase